MTEQRKKSILSLSYNRQDQQNYLKDEIPVQAFLYQPSSNEILDKLESWTAPLSKEVRYTRKIFEILPESYEDYEKKEIQSIKKEIKLRNINVDLSEWKDADLLKFLQSNNWKFDRAIADLSIRHSLQSYPAYRIDSVVLEILSKSRAFYMLGRDSSFRPNIYVFEHKLREVILDYGEEKAFEAIIVFLIHIENHLLVPGQVETWNVIIKLDSENSDLVKLNSKIRTYVNYLLLCFKCRVNSFYVYPFHPWARINFLRLISPSNLNVEGDTKEVRDSNSVKNVYFCKNKENLILSLEKSINSEQREACFGGTITSINQLFPPRSYSSNVHLNSNDNKRMSIMSKDEFLKKHESCQLSYKLKEDMIKKIIRAAKPSEQDIPTQFTSQSSEPLEAKSQKKNHATQSINHEANATSELQNRESLKKPNFSNTPKLIKSMNKNQAELQMHKLIDKLTISDCDHDYYLAPHNPQSQSKNFFQDCIKCRATENCKHC